MTRLIDRLVGAIVLAVLHEGDGKKHAGEAHTYETTDKPPKAPVPVYSVDKGWDADEKEHRRNEQRYWNRSLTFSGAAAVAAAIAAAFAIGAYQQAKRQADAAQRALIEADDPVMGVDVAKSIPLGPGDDGLPVITLDVTNYSNRAATLRSLSAGLVIGGARQSLVVSQQNCLLVFNHTYFHADQTRQFTCSLNKSVDVTALRQAKSQFEYVTGALEIQSQLGARWRKSFEFYYNPESNSWSETSWKGANDEVRVDATGEPITALAPSAIPEK